MTSATLTVDLGALVQNWQALNTLSTSETGAVVKANGYGLGVHDVSRALVQAGARKFFVATAQEGVIARAAIGQGPEIFVFSGHMDGDTQAIRESTLSPLLNSVDQMLRHAEAMPGTPFGIQLDTGMNRLGMESAEWSAVRDIIISEEPELIISHLACADEPYHHMNRTQIDTFRDMTAGLNVRRSLAATGGILLGPEYHFDLTRPGVGLYGGLPFVDARPVVTLDLPVIQVRNVFPGETVGYGNTWTAARTSRIATVSGGYADGLIRAMGPKATLFAEETPCPAVGRVSMDLITADITDVEGDPKYLQLLGSHQSVDSIAKAAGTIGYEILTSLGQRYLRNYVV